MRLALDQYRLLGRSGLRVSPLCLGTMTFGTEWGWGADKETSQNIFNTYADRGGNFIDTANRYTNGTSEEYVGDFLQGRRERFVVGTKYTLHMQEGNPNSGGNHRKNMVESVEASLRRLKTDYIDLFWVHAWEFRTPVEEVMRSLDDLVRQGKILYVAVSDAPAWKIAEANTLAKLRGWTPFIATQIHYNLVERTSEHEIIPMACELGLAVIPWSPLAGGVLAGKYGRKDMEQGAKSDIDAARQDVVKGVGQLTEHGLGIAEVVKAVAKEMGTSASQVALSWLLTRPGVTAPIIGARKFGQLQDNLGCLSVELSAERLQRLNTSSHPEPIFPNNFGATEMFRSAVDGESQIEGGFVEIYREF